MGLDSNHIFILTHYKKLLNNKIGMQQHRSASVIVRAEKFDTQEFMKNVSDKWDETENKVKGHARRRRAAALWVSSTSSSDQLSVVAKVMELVGLGYSAWFVYRYVLFKDSRKELQETVDDLLNKVSTSILRTFRKKGRDVITLSSYRESRRVSKFLIIIHTSCTT